MESYDRLSGSTRYVHKSRIPLPRSINVKPNGSRRTAEISHKKNVLLQSSVERKYDSTFYPASPPSPYGEPGRLFELSINDESDSFLPGKIDNHNNTVRSNDSSTTKRRNIKHSNKSNASVVMQRPGESFCDSGKACQRKIKKEKR